MTLTVDADDETQHADPATPATAADRTRIETFDRISHRVTIIGLGITVALVVAGFATGVFRSVEALRSFLDGFGIAAPIVFTLGLAIQSVFPVIPGGIGVVAGPILFGPVVGTICNYVGQVLGSHLAFFVARRLGRPFVESRLKSPRTRRYLSWLDHRHYPWWFAAAIAMPVAPDDLLCYLTGLTNMRKRTFFLIIVLCKPWSVMAYSFGIIALLNWIFPGLGL